MSIWDHLPWKKRQAVNIGEIAYKRMLPPQPTFFVALFAGIFMDESIGLEAEEMQRLVTTLPKGLRNQAPIWINLYLSYALNKLIEEKYGVEFARQSIEAVRQTAAHVDPKETAERLNVLSDAFKYWFGIFDQ